MMWCEINIKIEEKDKNEIEKYHRMNIAPMHAIDKKKMILLSPELGYATLHSILG